MTAPTAGSDQHKLLSIYLNDHLLGATGGLELARRTAGANAKTPFGPRLRELAGELEQDRDTLRQVMDALGVTVSRAKVAAGIAGERVGRLKLNGRIFGYSPLSRVWEIEALHGGVNVKQRLWWTLRHLADGEQRLAGFDFADLIDRADSQMQRLEDLHAEATGMALAPGGR